MHEASLASRFVQATLEEAAACGAGRVRAAGARIGELHGVIDRHLAEFYEAMTRGTLAEGARLVIERVAATSVCPECGSLVRGRPHFRRCPECGRAGLETVTGLEMELAWIEVE
ncbi:MAG TPA: hydrogenase maturation nickel metallochaperone HypA [Clostridiales bacterium]|nr:hydrogenase maturation nickel metallochaperone HypA [Clostridiales bacterium]